jgi:hypothetical protein
MKKDSKSASANRLRAHHARTIALVVDLYPSMLTIFMALISLAGLSLNLQARVASVFDYYLRLSTTRTPPPTGPRLILVNVCSRVMPLLPPLNRCANLEACI